MNDGAAISALRKQLWQVYRNLARTVESLQRAEPMVPGSFYLLRRKCGKPNCRCTRGDLHKRWVITRSEEGKDCIYGVPTEQRAQLRRLTGEYRRWQRARAVLVKRQQELLQRVDQLAEKRIQTWPPKK